MVEGLQVPVMPLFEVAASDGAADPAQIAGMAVKVGAMFIPTVTVSVAVVAH
jgi:hypothetical protein